MAFLVDTCVWIDVERGHLAPADVAALTAGEVVFLSPVTIAELSFGAAAAADADTRQRRRAALDRLRRKPTLPISAATGAIFGALAAEIRAAAQRPRQRVQDLWQASLALEYGCRFLTRNTRDFEDIAGLDLVSYELPAASGPAPGAGKRRPSR